MYGATRWNAGSRRPGNSGLPNVSAPQRYARKRDCVSQTVTVLASTEQFALVIPYPTNVGKGRWPTIGRCPLRSFPPVRCLACMPRSLASRCTRPEDFPHSTSSGYPRPRSRKAVIACARNCRTLCSNSRTTDYCQSRAGGITEGIGPLRPPFRGRHPGRDRAIESPSAARIRVRRRARAAATCVRSAGHWR